MLTGKELGDAIESARKAKGISKKKLAEDFGVTPPSVQGWVKNGRIDKAKLMQLMEYFAANVGPKHWGLTATPAQLAGSDKVQPGDLKLIMTDEAHRSPYYLTIPQLDVSASMGPGIESPGHVDTIRDITVRLEWLREQGVTYSMVENLAIITGDGDSMAGTFNNGDSLLVDRGITEIRTDAIYVFTLDGQLFIKRLQRMAGGNLRMISDNPIYPAMVIEGEQLDRVHIQARVLLAWNARKL